MFCLKKCKRLFFYCIYAVMIITILAGCDTQPSSLKIGFSGCLTGQLADLGIAGRNSVMMAVDEINAQGGINGQNVTLIIKDDKNVAERALQVDSDLIEEGVHAIIGHVTSSMSMAATPLINEKQIVMISPTSTTNKLSGKDDYFFRITSPDKIQSHIMAEYAFKSMALRRIACVYDLSNQEFTRGWLENFKTLFQQMGGNVIGETMFHAHHPFSYMDMMSDLLALDPDGILVLSGALHTAMFCQQIRKRHPTIPIISSGWAGTSELIRQGGLSVEGILFPQVFNPKSRNSSYITFRQNYLERFNKEPNFASMCSYEAATFLFSALKGWDGKSPIKPHLIHQDLFNGLQGKIRMDRFGDATRSQFIVTVKNSQFFIRETIAP